MPDIRNDHCGFGHDWLQGRTVGRPGLPVPCNYFCGIPIAAEGLGDVPFLCISVRH